MIFHEVVQQSPDWFRMRLGLATASCFDKIITPKTGALSKSADKYAAALLGEIITGESAEKFQSYWMERGAQMEADARSQYEAITELTLASGGFVTNDNMTRGASPDARVMDGTRVMGGTEIKCPAAATHIENLKRAYVHNQIDPDYIPQVQGQIFVGEFEFMDWFSYHPDMPPAHIRTYRDDAYCEKLEKALDEFDDIVNDLISMMQKMGVTVPERPIVAMHREATKGQSENPNYFMGG